MEKISVRKVLLDLIHIPSLSGDSVACQKIISYSQTLLRQQKVLSKVQKIGNSQVLIWGETDLSKTNWLINSHLDVVPAKSKQFSPQIKSGKIFGRGSADTKGGVAILLSMATNLTKLATKKHTTFMLVTDEEIGGDSTKKLIVKMKRLQGALFLEPTNEKSIIQAKGIMQIKIQGIGKACHGSRPWDGISALEQLVKSLYLFWNNKPTPTHETRQTTYNFSLMQSGTAINQVPAEATLWCDVRWNPKDNPKSIVQEIKKSFNKSKIDVIKLESPINCPENSIIFKNLSQALKQNKILVEKGFDHGSSDARHCTARNIPAIVFGPIGKNLHAENEWVSIKSLERVSKVLKSWVSLTK